MVCSLSCVETSPLLGVVDGCCGRQKSPLSPLLRSLPRSPYPLRCFVCFDGGGGGGVFVLPRVLAAFSRLFTTEGTFFARFRPQEKHDFAPFGRKKGAPCHVFSPVEKRHGGETKPKSWEYNVWLLAAAVFRKLRIIAVAEWYIYTLFRVK